MEIEDTRWARLRTLFDQATALPTGQRESFVDGSGADTDLRVEVAYLLDADQCQKKKPITAAIGAELEANAEDRRQRLVGATVGEYRLLGVIGHGGTGTVYLAERLDANGDSKVAIKIVEGAANNAAAKRRFRDERQILANLSHPYIARLFDAGDTSHGYPYLVMDYVDGEPIDRYCDRHRLTIRQRIELFLKVCEAVEYAHRNLVIHRDLKPQNILVTRNGTPKLLDFGIAKLLAERDPLQQIDVTRFQDQLLTPGYASPEQMLGRQISTASDVYTLGVVLYELMTGVKPFNQSGTTISLEYERTILTKQQTKPSNAVEQLLAIAPNSSLALLNIQRIGAARSTYPDRLSERLRGDIDAIALKALRPLAQDRYQTTAQLISDLDAFLSNQAVIAVNGTRRYHIRKFSRRYSRVILIAVIIVIALMVSVAAVAIQSRSLTFEREVANQEKQISDSVSEFMTNIFEYNDGATSKEMTASDLLQKAGERIHADLKQNSEIKAILLATIGNEQRRYGLSTQGIDLLEEALRLHEGKSLDEKRVATTYFDLAKAHVRYGDTDRAIELLSRLRTNLELKGNTASSEYGDLLIELGRAQIRAGHHAAARRFVERGIDILQRIYGPVHRDIGAAVNTLSEIEGEAGNIDLQTAALVKAEAIYKETIADADPDRLSLEVRLADHYVLIGDTKRAEVILDSVLRTLHKTFVPGSERLNDAMMAVIALKRAQRQFEEAVSIARAVLRDRKALLGENSRDTAFIRTTFGITLWLANHQQEAELQLRTAIRTYQKIFNGDSIYIASAEYFLAEVLLSQKGLSDSVFQSTATLEHLRRLNAVPWRIARVDSVLGAALFAQGKLSDAQTHLEQSYEILSATKGADLDTIQLAHDRLEHFYITQHQHEKLAALHAADLGRLQLATRNKT